MGLGLLDHAVDLVLRQARAAGDRHRLLLAGALVLGGHVHDAVGVDVEGHLDLRDAARRRGDAGQLEGAQRLVVARELTLALVDLDEHGRLVVLGGGEHLGTLGRDGGVAVDELGHDAALGLDAEAQRGHVDQQDVLAVALDDAGLHGGADGHDLVRVHGLVRFLAAGQLLDQVLDGRHTGRTADQHHMVDAAHADAGVGQHVVERGAAAAQQVGGHLLEVGAGQGLVQVHRGAVRGHGQVLHGDGGGGRARQLLLSLLGGFLQALQRDLVLGQIHAILVLDLGDQPVDDLLIPVVAAQTVVTVGGLDLDGGEAVLVLADLQQGHVEGAAAQIEDQDALVLLALLQTVGQGGRGRLVDDAQHVQTGDGAGVLGGLALGVVEVRRAGDDRVGHRLAQVGLGVALELHQDLRGDLLRGPLLAVDLDGPVGAHVALDRADGAVHVGHSLALGHLADEDLAGLAERHDRRRGARALGVHDDGGFTAFQRGDAGIGGSQIDAYCTSHSDVSFMFGCPLRSSPKSWVRRLLRRLILDRRMRPRLGLSKT